MRQMFKKIHKCIIVKWRKASGFSYISYNLGYHKIYKILNNMFLIQNSVPTEMVTDGKNKKNETATKCTNDLSNFKLKKSNNLSYFYII